IPRPSIGFTCGVIFKNDGTLMSGTTITVPPNFLGSMRPISFCSAMIDVYSVPWLPPMNATVGPARTPRTTATGICSDVSLPGGIAISPYAVVPAAAVAEPTVTAGCCATSGGAAAKMSIDIEGTATSTLGNGRLMGGAWAGEGEGDAVMLS